MSRTPGPNETITIKKYANRRLYDTSTSAYVTLDHLSALVREGRDFIVLDARTNEDLTRSVLTQIIFEQENRRDGVLPVSFLRQLIQLYGESVQAVLPAYLELSMRNFASQQDKWRDYMKSALGEDAGTRAFDDQIRKNIEIFDEAMRIFTPFAPRPPRTDTPGETAQDDTETATLAALQKQLTDMQAQLAAIAASASSAKRK
jgi:polyhydroxyalkanoate synthesis repressor PhaR